MFAAIYGHSVVENPGAAIETCFYGRAPRTPEDTSTFHIPSLYEDVCSATRPKFTRHRYAGEEFHLRHGLDRASGRPDWLAEIFYWLSSASEAHIAARDEIGRIPYAETVFGREGLSPHKPHAALLMAWMESALQKDAGEERLTRAPSPLPPVEHLVLCSHDVDFYYVDRTSTLARLVKNLGIAVRLYHSRSYFIDNLRMIVQLLRRKHIGDYLPRLLEATRKCDVQSTLFAVSRRGHRRDPNYEIEQISGRLLSAAAQGFSIGLHGSYRSVNEDHSLRQEASRLADEIGLPVLAGRQHWLRFGSHADLFAEVAEAGLLVDSTLGFPDMVGFRNGASFAFPPYDFTREAPHEFLEVPLVLMDGSLQSAAAQLGTDATELAETVLAQSRKVGWGGVAILWHNPLDPLSVPAETNDVFWTLAKSKRIHHEKWVSMEQFLHTVLPRYQQAGLLQGVRFREGKRFETAIA